VWRSADRRGGVLALYHSGCRRTLSKRWRGAISSYATGCEGTVRSSDLPKGAGAKIERPPREAGAKPPGWNDRVDAIYRS